MAELSSREAAPQEDAPRDAARHATQAGGAQQWGAGWAGCAGPRPRKWGGSGRLGRRSWAEAGAARASPTPCPVPRVIVDARPAGRPSAIAARAGIDAERPTLAERTPEELGASPTGALRCVESEREAIERRHASHKLAETLVAKFGDGSTATPMELVAAKVAEVAHLEAELNALRVEKRALEDALEVAESRLCEETKRAERAEAELSESRDGVSTVAGMKQGGSHESTNKSSGEAPTACRGELPGSPLAESPRKHIEAIQLERVQGFQSPALRDMFIGCVELLAADIYASQAHFVLELLQNADDNEFRCSDGEVPTARFAVHSDEQGQAYVVVANNEVGLSPQDVVGLCAISKSSKAGKKDRTGRKGIGFKSVFAVSTCPHILSGAYTFKFDVREDRMGYITPTWLEEEELAALPPEVLAMHREGLTCVYLPLAPGAARSGLLSEVEGHLEALDPATLLFLRRLRRVEVRRSDGRTTTLEYMGSARPGAGVAREAVALSSVPLGDGPAEPPKEERRDFLVSRTGAEDPSQSPLAVALPAPQEGGGAPLPQRAFATLPLCHTGLAAAVNADWDVSASRDGVHENHKNERLVLEAAKAFVRAAQHLGAEAPYFSPLDYLGDRAPLQRFWRLAREKFLQELIAGDVPCIPVEEDTENGEARASPLLIAAAMAVRRPGMNAPAAERTAADLVDIKLLRCATGRHFAREPLPAGVEIETFSLRHYLQCLPHLVEAAMALSTSAARGSRLANLYRALLDLLQEPASGAGPALALSERVKLIRSAAIFPVHLRSGGEAVAALVDGPVFASSSLDLQAGSLQAFIPASAKEVSSPGRLRILTPEARDAVPSALCSQTLGLRSCAKHAHCLGLCMELHTSDGATPKAEDPAHIWASLEFIRDSLDEESNVEAGEETEADPLVDEGRMLLQNPERLAALLFVPATDGSLRHAGSLRCPLVLGLPCLEYDKQEGNATECASQACVFAASPPSVVSNSDPLLRIRWERFFVYRLKMKSVVLELDDPSFQVQAQLLCQQLLSYEWWMSIAADLVQRQLLEDYIQWFARAHAGVLSALPSATEAGGWRLRDFFSADFAAFFVQCRIDDRSPPLLVATAGELSPLARECLLTLGLALYVDDEALIRRCAPLLLRAETVPPEALARVYGALGPCDGGLLEVLREGICVPGHGLAAAKDCVFLPQSLQGLGQLVGKPDLRACFPELHGLFVGRLGVADSVPAGACVAALRTLRARTEDAALDTDVAGTAESFRMAASAYRQLQLADPSNEAQEALRSFEAEPLLLSPGAAKDQADGVPSRAQWRLGRGCMWYDVPAGCQQLCASLEAHYPADLKPFFAKQGVAEINANEVFARMAGLASLDDLAVLAKAYGDMDRVRRDAALCSDEPLRMALGAGVEVPGQGAVPTEDCVFLREADQGVSRLTGAVDLGAHYPGLLDFFTDYLGVRTALPPEEVVTVLRRLRAAHAEAPPEEAANTLQLATSAYGLILAQEEALGGLAAGIFASEPLLLVPSADGHGTWRSVDECMWHDAPAGARVRRDALEPHYPAELRPFFTDALGVHRLDASEVLARLELVAAPNEGAGSDGGEGARLRSAYGDLGRVYSAGSLQGEEGVLDTLRDGIFIPGQGAVGVQSCVFLKEECAGIGNLLGKIDLRMHYPGEEAFFTTVLSVPNRLSAAECFAAVQELPGQAEGPQLARAIYNMLETESFDAASQAFQSVFVPGLGLVDRKRCVYLEQDCEGLAELFFGVDLRPHYPELRRCFLEHLQVRGELTADECLDALRVLRARGESGEGEGQEETRRLAFAAYGMLERAAVRAPQVLDLSLCFEEEPLLFVPGEAAKDSWRRSGECTWHDAPASLLASRAALEPHYPQRLAAFALEALGVRALDAGEVCARLDALLAQGAGLPRFAEAYAQIQEAREAREREGLQFWDPKLLEGVGQRIFVGGTDFKLRGKCMWQPTHGRARVATTAGRHNLLEVYEALQVQKVALLRKLKPFFVDWLRVSECLSVEECLDGLRALEAGKVEPQAGESVQHTAKALYCELARALKSCEADDAVAASKAFKKEALTYVPGTGGQKARFCTADQCIWRSPAEAPEGWELTRSELAPHYADESSLKSLFTERLGVPMSVRFSNTQEKEEPSVQQTPPGQPVWLLTSSEGKRMVPQQRSATPPPSAEAEAAEASDAAEDVDAEGEPEGSQTPPSHLERGYAGVEATDEPEPPENSEGDRGEAGDRDQRRRRGPDKFTLPDRSDSAAARKDDPDGPETSPNAPPQATPWAGGKDVPPPPEPHARVRGIAADGRKERKKLLEKLSQSVNASCCKQMNSQASRIKHRPEESIDCNPEHDIERWAVLELLGQSASSSVSIPVWVEREGRAAAVKRLEAARNSGDLERFAALLMSLGELFSIQCRDRINIFEEDTQAVAFNGGALYFNLRYFVEERHSESWEDAVSFWTISFAHELAHFESLIHDRLHGRTMEHTQRAVLPSLPKVLGRPWGRGASAPAHRWKLHGEGGVPP